MKAIETNNLTKFYGKARGITDVTLSVDEGDFFGFIGPNGAGKSTLIRTLLGLISKTSGEAKIFGLDTQKQKTEILKNVGYLPSEAVFYSGMRVSELISFSAGLRGIKCGENAKKLCKRLDLDTSRRINELSLGNRKKVGIVCAMQHNPSLYILDEPTSGLDPLMQHEVYSLLLEKCNEGATVFLSSHVLSEIGRYCKHAAVIREGRILACDSVSNLSHTDAKRVTLGGVSEIDMPEARDIKYENGNVSFLYGGDVKELIKSLGSIDFNDITVENPELDEIFLHFYKEGE